MILEGWNSGLLRRIQADLRERYSTPIHSLAVSTSSLPSLSSLRSDLGFLLLLRRCPIPTREVVRPRDRPRCVLAPGRQVLVR